VVETFVSRHALNSAAVHVSGNNIILPPPLILASADVTKMAEGISAGLSAASQGARTGDGAFE